MKKTFIIEGTEYTVEEITAIATCAGEHSEDDRQYALLVTNVADSGEKIEHVVFGYDMPENDDDFSDMCEDSAAWDSDCETLETVKLRSF